MKTQIWNWFSNWLNLKASMAMFPLVKGTQTVRGIVMKKLPNVLSVVSWSEVPAEGKRFGWSNSCCYRTF